MRRVAGVVAVAAVAAFGVATPASGAVPKPAVKPKPAPKPMYASEEAASRWFEDNGLRWKKPYPKETVYEALCQGKGTPKPGTRDEYGNLTMLYRKFVCYVKTSGDTTEVAMSIDSSGVYYNSLG